MLLVAHRTPSTAPACERLAAAGAGVFEVDLQLDPAGRMVISHHVPFGPGGLLQRDTWRVRRTAAARDPHLQHVLAAVPAGSTVLLDLKARDTQARARLVAAIIDTLRQRDRFAVCTPHPQDLEPLRVAGFRTWRTVGDRAQLEAVLSGPPLPDEAVTVRHTLLSGAVVERLRRQVPTVVAWTVNNPRRAGELRRFGVGGVTTDRVSVMHALTTRIHGDLTPEQDIPRMPGPVRNRRE